MNLLGGILNFMFEAYELIALLSSASSAFSVDLENLKWTSYHKHASLQ